ncbi:MAG: methyl-accepting chemotaxis protein [candidate division WOR-3 bacterium]|nr:methyl-accepting chemotaxis protein [candidate division WOR-3 bacterium]
MNILNFRSWDLKRKIGFFQILSLAILFAIFMPLYGIRFSKILFILFFATFLFRYRPLPLRKYSYLSLCHGLSILLYFLYGSVQAAFWTFIFLLIADVIFKKGVFQALVNASAYALSILIVGGLMGTGIMNNWPRLSLFFAFYYIILIGLFYLPEFVARKTRIEEIIYINSWEIFYYILATSTAIIAYKVTLNPTIGSISLFGAGFLILRYFIRRVSSKAIEGSISRDLIQLQSAVMKKSFDETLKAVESYSSQYIDWTGLNILKLTDNEEELKIIYSASKKDEPGYAISIHEGIKGRCVKERRAIIVRDTSREKDYEEPGGDARSEMLIPLIYGENVLGVLDFEHDLVGTFTEKEVEYAKFFASQLSYALQTNITLQPLISSSEKLEEFTDESIRAMEKITGEMNSIHENMKEVIRGGEEQVRSLVKVENAMDELLSSHENIKTLREEMSEGMKEFTNTLDRSGNSVEENLTRLSGITDAIGEVKETVKTLTDLSSGVMKIADSSKNIAEDTSLLALNASIEATRTAKESKTFSVIAGEINKLANTASSNSDEISNNAKIIMKNVKDFSKKIYKVVGATENIGAASSSIMEQFDLITSELSSLQEGLDKTYKVSKREIQDIEDLGARIEQAAGIGKDNIGSIKGINQLIEEQSIVSGDLSEKITNLKSSMERLKEIVEEFRLTHLTT